MRRIGSSPDFQRESLYRIFPALSDSQEAVFLLEKSPAHLRNSNRLLPDPGTPSAIHTDKQFPGCRSFVDHPAPINNDRIIANTCSYLQVYPACILTTRPVHLTTGLLLRHEPLQLSFFIFDDLTGNVDDHLSYFTGKGERSLIYLRVH